MKSDPTPPAPRDATPGTAFRRRAGLVVLALALAAGAALRLWLAFNDDGIYWPDEIHQGLEPAHRLVFGYGLQAWEYVEGARNWTFAAAVALLLKAGVLLGFDSPDSYLGLVRAVFALLGVATVLGCYRLARASGASESAAACGAAMFALGAPFIYFAPRVMSETASALAVVLGFALALDTRAARSWRLAGVSLLGLSVLLRLQNAIFCSALLGILAAREQRRQLTDSLIVLGAWAFLFGLMDWLTWGRWFQSVMVYLRFNVIEGGASRWGTAPFDYYPAVLWSSMPEVAGALAVLAVAAFPRARGLLLTALAFVVAHSLTPHKEWRFLLPALPLFCALAGAGIERLSECFPGRPPLLLRGVVLMLATASAVQFRQLTFGDLGHAIAVKHSLSAYDDFGPVNRLLVIAGRQPDLGGLKIECSDLAWSGGHSYLHRRVPLYGRNGPPRASRFFNYVITLRKARTTGELVASDGDFVLLRISRDGCAADAAYDWRLK